MLGRLCTIVSEENERSASHPTFHQTSGGGIFHRMHIITAWQHELDFFSIANRTVQLGFDGHTVVGPLSESGMLLQAPVAARVRPLRHEQ